MSTRNVIVPNILLKAYGFWDYGEPDHILYRVHRTLGICIFVLGFSALENIRLVVGFLENNDLAKTTDDLAHSINHVLGAYKFFLMMSQRKFIQNVYERSIRDERITYKSTPQFDAAMRKAVDDYTTMNILCSGFASILPTLFIVLGYSVPFLADTTTYYDADSESMMTTRPLPFNTWMPFPEGRLPNYYWAFAYQGISMTEMVLMISSFDIMFYGMVAQMAAQFRILRYAVSTVHQRANDIVRQKLAASSVDENNALFKLQFAIEIQNELKKCAIHHKNILRTCHQINERFNFNMLFQFSTTLVVFCVCLFQCLVRSGLRLDFVYMIFYALTSANELFLFCWFGKEVTSESAKLPEALISAYWVGATPQYRSNYWLFLTRSQNPVVFSALGLFPLDLTTFGSIIRTGYSFFSVLKQVDTE